MSFIKLIRSDATRELIRHPNEFALLALIAERAKRTTCFSAKGLSPGEAMIGAGNMVGMSARQYRTAKERLKKWGFTDLTPTNRGTIAKIVSRVVFDPNIVINDAVKMADRGKATDRESHMLIQRVTRIFRKK